MLGNHDFIYLPHYWFFVTLNMFDRTWSELLHVESQESSCAYVQTDGQSSSKCNATCR